MKDTSDSPGLAGFGNQLNAVYEFITPSEALAASQYVADHYLSGRAYMLANENVQVEHSQHDFPLHMTLCPLSGQWSEELPEERLVLRGPVGLFDADSSLWTINELNSENPDIKLLIAEHDGTQQIFLEQLFTLVGGTTINHFIESIIQFTSSQHLLKTSLDIEHGQKNCAKPKP